MVTITEDYVSFEVAKLLKEKGFLIPSTNFEDWVFCMYDENGDIQWGCYSSEWYVRVTLQMVIKWLREVHNIFISIVFCTYPTEKRVTWTPEISTFDSVFPESAIEYDSYEQASEEAVKYCLEHLI